MTAPKTGWLIDTNVVSEFRKVKAADRNVQAWAESQSKSDCFISVVTEAELRAGFMAVSDVSFRGALEVWLSTTMAEWFGNRVLPLDLTILLRWLRLLSDARAVRYTYPQPDGLIAATAIVHGLTVVTRNIRDFEQSGVPLLNPRLAPA